MILEQSTLIKFFPCLEIKNLKLNRAIKPRKRNKESYNLVFEPTNDIKIKQTHCLECNSRLVKNGWNFRILILDNQRGKDLFRLNRKRCPKCGEIRPDLSRFAGCFLYLAVNPLQLTGPTQKSGLSNLVAFHPPKKAESPFILYHTIHCFSSGIQYGK